LIQRDGAINSIVAFFILKTQAIDKVNAALCGKFGAQRKICPTAALC